MAQFHTPPRALLAIAAVNLLGAALLFAATVGTAHAGQYHVYSCRTPAGEAAPTDGWSGVVEPAGAHYNRVEETCKRGGALTAYLLAEGAHSTTGEAARWSFDVPPVDPLVSATFWRAGDAAGGNWYGTGFDFSLSGSTPALAFDRCVSSVGCPGKGQIGVPFAKANEVKISSPNVGTHISVTASCFGDEPTPPDCVEEVGDPNGYAAVVYVYAADFLLEQTLGPTVSYVGGELASAPTVGGTSDVEFSATDPGAGIYQAVFSVDGKTVQQTVVDENGGRCRNVGQSADGLPAFLYLQPCLPSVSVDVGLDTRQLSNGPHRLAVTVTDAAGNAAPVLERELTVSNPVAGPGSAPSGPGPANGANASGGASLAVGWSHSKRARLLVGYGKAETVAGRLTAPGGAPISGAQIEVRATPGYPGARTTVMATPITDRDGRFSLKVPAGVSSRVLSFAYRAHLADALPALTRTLTLSVRAGISLRVAPRTVSVGQSIFFRGRLLGTPVPRDGKQLVLEARSPGGHWIEFDVIRTDSHGRFRASYRFKFPGPVNYQFRVLSEPESDYPFAAGASVPVGVHER